MFVSVIIVRGILAELQSHGIAQADVLAGLDVREEALADIRARISFADIDRVIARAMNLSGDAGLGLSMGVNAPESMLQILGHLIVSCRTLRDAFGMFQRYAPLVGDGLTYTLTEDSERARFTYHCPIPLDATSRFAAEYVLVTARRIASHFINDPNQRAELVWFEHDAPDYAHRYGRVFECPVLCSQSSNMLQFNRRLLDQTQPHADAAVNTALRDMAERMLQEIDGPRTVSERIRVLLRYESDLSDVEVAKLSRSLGMTPRSLRRKLAAEGVSLTGLIDEARCRLACDELRRHGSIKAIAERVGFSEPSAFHRAFKRWTGQTPLEYLRGT